MKANIKWLDAPEVFRINQLPAHSDHPFTKITVNGKPRSSFKQSQRCLAVSFFKILKAGPIDFYNAT